MAELNRKRRAEMHLEELEEEIMTQEMGAPTPNIERKMRKSSAHSYLRIDFYTHLDGTSCTIGTPSEWERLKQMA